MQNIKFSIALDMNVRTPAVYSALREEYITDACYIEEG